VDRATLHDNCSRRGCRRDRPVNSLAGQFGQTNYAAAKAGMIGFTKALALESAARGILGDSRGLMRSRAPLYSSSAMGRRSSRARRSASTAAQRHWHHRSSLARASFVTTLSTLSAQSCWRCAQSSTHRMASPQITQDRCGAVARESSTGDAMLFARNVGDSERWRMETRNVGEWRHEVCDGRQVVGNACA